MTVDAASAPPLRTSGLAAHVPLLSLALRELRGGLRGFYVFVACVALGVAVIAGVGALSDALRAGFEKQGEALLGGDVTLARPHRRIEPGERAWLNQRGRVSETATLRAMARRLDATEQVLVELKGIDAAYPLVGALTLRTTAAPIAKMPATPASAPPITVAAALADNGAAVDEILLERLQLKLGDRVTLGNRAVVIRAIVDTEPDKITDRLTFGPRVFVALATLDGTGLAEPGSLVRWRYALKLDENTDSQRLISFRDAAKAQFPDAGFTVADRRDPAPQVTKTLERLKQFLTLIGLTSLLVGGVGIANAVSTYIDRRRKVIATFKSLGASSRQIFLLHLVQILLISALGVAIGLALGMLLPAVLNATIGDALPIRAEIAVRPMTLLIATVYGLLVALLFTLWPLGRAEQVRAGVLFRDEVAPEYALPRPGIIVATIACGLAMLALALVTSESQKLAFYFCLGLAGVFAVFHGLGSLLSVAARRVKRPRRPELALAIASLGAPGGLTRSVVLSLGSGLSLLVAVALTDAAIIDELQSRLPKNSPNFFVLDIPRSDIDGFTSIIRREQPAAHVNQAPMLRGRIVRLAGKPVEEMKIPPQAQWVLNGDRGLTYADEVPEGSKLVKGDWWAKDYDGEPLVSFEAELAKLLGIKIGDTVTINILGRNIEARIANLREVHWESLAINFVMVLSPNALKGAPHNLMATVALPKEVTIAKEAELARQIGKAYPAVTAIRVKDAINSFNSVFTKIMKAVRAAGSITLLAGGLVLAGALATAQRRRIKQAVIIKVLGGTRAKILTMHALEYGILALATALVALVVGSIAAYATLTQVMDVPFVFSLGTVVQAIGVSLILVMLLGAFGTWRVLTAPAVPYLRSE